MGSLKPTETGFYYLNSRCYNPEVGRFINADAFASTDTKDLLGTNMFAYCENNPINNHDSNGDFCIASAIVGEVLNAGLAVAGAYIDSLISGESVKGSDLAVDVIVAFGTGFVQGGTVVKTVSTVNKTVQDRKRHPLVRYAYMPSVHADMIGGEAT